MNKSNLFTLFMASFSVVEGTPLPDGKINRETCREGISGFVTEANHCSNRHSDTESANFTFDVIKGDWGRVEDHRYGIEFQVPKDCHIVITIDQPQPFVDPQAIIRRYTAWCPQGLLDLDIWQSGEKSLEEWIKWYESSRQPLGSAESRSTIGEIEAVNFEEAGLRTAFWAGEKEIFRLWHTHQKDEAGEEFYKRVLNSIRFLKDDPTKGEDASQSFQGLSLEGFSTANPLVTTCCGYSSPGNPFRCCDNKGNCVWWVYYKYGSVPFRGDAWTWWDQVPDYIYIGWGRGNQPRRDWRNIAWWNKSSSSDYGHVAYAATYTGGSTITISEMLYCNSCGRTRTINVSAANGYIFEAKHIPTGINGGE